jgi:IS1 family transposase
MPNVLKKEKQIAIIAGLAEGMAIRQVERVTGVFRDTIMNYGLRVGQGCAALMDEKMRNLDCTEVQMDEIWGFIGKKVRHLTPDDDPTWGDIWTFCAIDADSKLVPSYKIGKRDAATANAFVYDLASRLSNRIQLSSDALPAYHEAVERSFGGSVDYGMIVKSYATDNAKEQRRYSPAQLVSIKKTSITGRPNPNLVSTSYIERLNGTTRHHVKRLARLTLAFSKRLESFEAAMGLYFMYYNFVKPHRSIRCTPAIAAGVTNRFWTVGDLVERTIG